MGTTNLEIIKPERERGTLNETLPKQPIILISLVCIASAALSTALLLYSTPHLLATTNKVISARLDKIKASAKPNTGGESIMI